MVVVGIILGLVGVLAGLYLWGELRGERTATRQRLADQDARIGGLADTLGSRIGEMAEDLGTLRLTMVGTGAAERGAKLPAPPKLPGAAIPPAPDPAAPSTAAPLATQPRDEGPPSTSQRRRANPSQFLLDMLDHIRAIDLGVDDGVSPERSAEYVALFLSAAERLEALLGVLPAGWLSRVRAQAAARETSKPIRARLEREEDEQEMARGRGELGAVPMPGEDCPSEENTQVFTGRPADVAAAASNTARPPPLPRGPNLGAAPAPASGPQRPPPTAQRMPMPSLFSALSRVRAPDDERKTIQAPAPFDLGATMVSATAPPTAGEQAAKLSANFAERIAAGGNNVAHCAGPECNNDPAGVCACACKWCKRRRRVLAQARLEVLGPTSAQRHAAQTRHAWLVAEAHQGGRPIAHCRSPECCGPPRERVSEVDTLSPEEICACFCAEGCAEMRRALRRAFAQIVDEAVT